MTVTAKVANSDKKRRARAESRDEGDSRSEETESVRRANQGVLEMDEQGQRSSEEGVKKRWTSPVHNGTGRCRR